MSNPNLLGTPGGRTALVTGAGKRLGREIALHLAGAGWHVAVHHHQSAAEAVQTVSDCAALGVRACAVRADLSDETACRELVPQVIAQLGSLDAVVNSASVFEHDSVAGFGHHQLDRHLHTNTAAPVLLAQALHTHLGTRPGVQGCVVNLLDQKLWNMNPDFVSYTLSKAALESATTLLALALAPRTRVVGVAPGLTLTSHMLSDERFQALHQQALLGRSSTPADVASAVRFALENPAITGTSLLVDGGQHLMRFDRDFSLM
jgi:NAD(P)-dependent dehydrogenase (short-subunit alcohol dehydrogenase family)